jgi:hypothetical protein
LSIRLCLGDPLTLGDGTSKGLRFRRLAAGGEEILRVLRSKLTFSFLDWEATVGLFLRVLLTGDVGPVRVQGELGSTISPADISVRGVSGDGERSASRWGEDRSELRIPVGAGTIAIERRPYVFTLRVCIPHTVVESWVLLFRRVSLAHVSLRLCYTQITHLWPCRSSTLNYN